MRHAFSVHLVANYAGAAWATALQVLLVPLYVHYLGREGYGLVGFCITLQAVAQFLDLGLGNTVNRELARRGDDPAQAAGTQDFVRTIASLYWVLGALLGLGVAGAAEVLATDWVNLHSIAPADARAAIVAMGVVIALQWPASCYGGALLGLHRQLQVNAVNIGASTMFGATALLVIACVAPTATAFLWCRAGVLAVQVVVARRLLARALPAGPPGTRARFDLRTLAPVWQFSLGMLLISLTAVLLMQFDKVVLSKLLSLEMFGCYMVAASAATCIPALVAPLYTAVFPRMSRLVAAGDAGGQAHLFHQSAQLIAVVVQPVAVAFALFAPDILAVWTRDATVTAHASGVLTLLALGGLLNSVMVVPYVVQLAFGATRLGVIANVVMLSVMLPYAIVATRAYGLCGAASSWFVVNAVYLAVGATLTFRRLMRAEARCWLLGDVLRPVATIAAVQTGVWWLGADFDSAVAAVMKVALAISLSAAAVLAGARELRAGIVTVALAWRASLGGGCR